MNLTSYIKNFDRDELNHLFDKLTCATKVDTPLWSGTVYIGARPLYVECHIKYLADKIENYFVNVLPGVHVEGAYELYILNRGVREFVNPPDPFDIKVVFSDSNMYRKPDLIMNDICLFMARDKVSIMSLTNDESSFFYLGENHILMRVFYHVFNDDDFAVLHGGCVGYNGDGVLISGLSGYGKSTLSAHCLSMGAQFIGDDRIGVHLSNGIPVANPIYKTLSLGNNIPENIKITGSVRQWYSTKDTLFLEKKQISNNVKIRAVLEPVRCPGGVCRLEKCRPGPILTRLCTDFSKLSVLTSSKNPVADYNHIFNLLGDCEFYKLYLSDSIPDNAATIMSFLTKGAN